MASSPGADGRGGDTAAPEGRDAAPAGSAAGVPADAAEAETAVAVGQGAGAVTDPTPAAGQAHAAEDAMAARGHRNAVASDDIAAAAKKKPSLPSPAFFPPTREPRGCPRDGSEKEDKASAEEPSSPPTRRPTVRQRTLRAAACAGSSQSERFEEHRKSREKDSQVHKLVKAAMDEVRVCATLTEADVMAIIEAMHFFEFQAGHIMQRQGEPCELFIVVQDGRLEVKVDDETDQMVTAGRSFGADGLLYGCPRTTVVTTKEVTSIWAADGTVFQEVLRERARSNCSEYRKVLQSISLFEGLPARQMDLLSQALFEEAYPPDAQVVAKGEDRQTFYCVKSGTLRVVDPSMSPQDPDLMHLRPGDCFGEQALLYGERRATTVISEQRCELLCIGAAQLRSVLGTDLHAYLERSVVLSSLRTSSSYSQFSSRQQNALMQAMEMKDCQARECIADEVTKGVRFIVVISGSITHPGVHGMPGVIVHRGESCEADSVGMVAVSEEGALSPARRAAAAAEPPLVRLCDFVAGSEGARISVLTQDTLVKGLGRRQPAESATQAAEYAAKMLLVRKVPIFRHLSHEQTESVVSALRLETYQKNGLVIEQGSRGSSMYVISRGEVSIFINDQLVRTQGQNACFGERALLFDERRTATVKVSSLSADIWTIDKATFEEIIRGKMHEDLIHRIKLQDTQVTLQDLRMVKVIGTGAFSVVRLVEHKRTGVRYALKSVRKQKGEVPVDMANECSILLENDHPFILYVVKTFETDSRVCMLTELITGGDLHGAIRQIPTVLSRRQAQFYLGSLIIAVEALWDRNIVYRDLKPENVMLDAQGYLKIIDFGISKKLKNSESRTFTTVGTPHYMAPEVMQGRGYGIEVDIWSMGVMLFEFVCGYLPFADELDEPAEVCTAVLSNMLVFPRTYRDKAGRDLIAGLLCRKPEQRLGAGANGCADIKAALFFRIGIGTGGPNELFDKIMGRELDPPLLPKGETYCDDEDMEVDQVSDAEDLFPGSPVHSKS